MKARPLLSFVIPCFNEGRHISDVLGAIRKTVDGIFPCEIVVVDNGSTDNSRSIAEPLCDQLISVEKATISALRNRGVGLARGDVLVFIDADVVLSETWGTEFVKEIERLERDPAIVTGNTYAISRTPGWIETCWFEPILQKDDANYINGGHLIVTRTLFDRVGGFDQALETSEDYDFCARARKAGATIHKNKRLIAYHLGYPTTIQRFFHRERWHGRGDYQSLKTFLSSKPALVAVAQFALLVACLAAGLLVSATFFLAYLLLAAGICAGLAYVRCRRVDLAFAGCIPLYYIYLQARTVSLFDVLGGKRSAYHTRIK